MFYEGLKLIGFYSRPRRPFTMTFTAPAEPAGDSAL